MHLFIYSSTYNGSQVLADMSVRQRYFEGWNMDSLNLDKAELFTLQIH
jgi:hypothetical protein